MRVLLDENFPLGLLRALRADGIEADHVITLGWRGVSDRELRSRSAGDVLLLTQDTDFLMADLEPFSIVVVSRVRQTRRVSERIDICGRAVRALPKTPRAERLLNSPTMVSCCRGLVMGCQRGPHSAWLREFGFS